MSRKICDNALSSYQRYDMKISELYKGRPADFASRLPKERKCYETLDRLGIEYFRTDHDYADTIEMCHEVEKVLGADICKNLFLTNRQQTEFYLLLMPGDKPFRTKLLSKQINTARLSFASPEHMERYLDITPGSVSVLGLLNDSGSVRLVIDEDLLSAEHIGCHPCINSSTLKFRTSELLEKLLPETGHSYDVVRLPWVIEE
ncbi:MAG: prolyl-tRNA synthetase associated domain-containing protein [Oscillospiraceae bacterium]|nr:prolyl-tRNA synthetase associated domain-containing protein [Oscillospiraceae bacterium]